MPTRLVAVVVDAGDPADLARWWAEALGWQILDEDDEGTEIGPPPEQPPAPTLVLVPVAEPKVAQNRVHLDLASSSLDDQAAIVAGLEARGARRIDIGQGDVPWVVMADPEGNELCVLEPRPEYAATGPVAAIVVHTQDPARLAPFWAAASGWPVAREHDGTWALREPGGRGPWLELVASADPKRVKHRWHLDVAPPAGGDQAAEVARLVALGAVPADVGQRDVSWVVLADPDGGELCVLSPTA